MGISFWGERSKDKMVVSSVMQPEAEEAAPAEECSGTCKRRMIAGGEMS